MPWTQRQRAMLEEMGLRIWTASASDPANESVRPDAEPVSHRPRPSGVGVANELEPQAVATEPTQATARPDPQVTCAQGVGHLAWAELRDAVAGCTACRLCSGRTNTVFGVGHPRAQWMIIGEAPGEQEDVRGEPFVGKSGQLLDSMLRALNLTRAEDAPERQVFIANTLKCRPPSNRNPEPDELAKCEPFLVRQIELVQPRIILAMGRFALQSLLRNDEPVGRLRGRVHSYQGLPLVATYHPAYLLRNPIEKARAWDDLCLARDVARRA